jgi:hypothetical protein
MRRLTDSGWGTSLDKLAESLKYWESRPERRPCGPLLIRLSMSYQLRDLDGR